jgi:outer membrane protein TolC
MSKSEIEKNGYNKNVTVSKYLPRVSIVAGYNWQKNKDQTFYAGSGSVTQETNYYNYGLKASIPIDINTFRDIEVAKVDYLKSKLLIEDKKRQLIATFEQVMQNIQNLDNKKQLSVENKDIYKELLAETSEQYNAGYKTKYDVELLQNSVHIQELDVEIYEIDKQLELLTLYETYIYE